MKLKKYLTTYNISLRNAIYYRSNLVGGIIMYTLFIYVFFCLWQIIYQGDTIAGYTFPQMIWYVCATEVVAMSMGFGSFYQIGQEIKNGSIAYKLGRPYHYIWYQFANSLGSSSIRFIVFTAIAGVVGTIFVGAPPITNFWAILFFIISLLLSFLLKFFMLMSIALTAFFVEENRPFFFIYSKLVLILGTFVPIEFFPNWLQSVLKYMPFSLVAWAPAKMFVGFSWDHALFAIPAQLIWTLIFINVAMATYRKGVRAIHVHGG